MTDASIPNDRIITPAEARILAAPSLASNIERVNGVLAEGSRGFSIPAGLADDMREALRDRGWTVTSDRPSEFGGGYVVWVVAPTEPEVSP